MWEKEQKVRVRKGKRVKVNGGRVKGAYRSEVEDFQGNFEFRTKI